MSREDRTPTICLTCPERRNLHCGAIAPPVRCDELDDCPAGHWIPATPSMPPPGTVRRWAVGVTTAPRSEPTLARSISSLRAAGWAPHEIRVFAEPESPELDRLGVPVVRRPARCGAFRNWLQALAELLDVFPAADAFALCQDDVVYARGLRAALESELWPAPDALVVSPYCPADPSYDRGPDGWRAPPNGDLITAQVLVLSRPAAELLLAHPLARTWRGRSGAVGDPAAVAHIDGYVGAVLRDLARRGRPARALCYAPSLAAHVSAHSTLGHGPAVGFRSASRFVGDDADAAEICAGRFAFQPCGPLAVIIPAHGGLDLTLECVRHVARQACEIVYVDDGSPDQAATLDAVDAECGRLGVAHRAIAWRSRRGFTPAVNAGLAACRGRDVLLLNNDCFVGPGCIDQLLAALRAHPRAAAANPLTDDEGCLSIRRPQWQQRGGSVAVAMLPFWCTLIRAAALEQLGPLHAAFRDGLAADDEWCGRARRHGWELLAVTEAWADHLGHQTFEQLGLDRPSLVAAAHQRLARLPAW